MKKIKTIGLSFGAVMVLATPAIVMVSCGSDEQQTVTPRPEDVTIDISNLSVEQTIDAIVKAIKVNMDQLGEAQDAWTLTDNLVMIQTYMKQIDVNKSVFLQNGNDKYELNFRPVKHWVDVVIQATEQEHNPNIAVDGSSIGAALMQGEGMPEIAVYVGETLGTAAGIAMGNFMKLSTLSYDDTPHQQFFENHGYVQMLNEYHKIMWDFVNSQFYKTWITGKKFVLIESGTKNEYNPGEFLDVADRNWSLPPKMHEGVIQSSNFEAEFGLRLLNAYAYLERTKTPDAINGLTYYYDDSSFMMDWEGIKTDFPDFTDANYDWMWDKIKTVPTGWHSVDYKTLNADGSGLVPVQGFELAFAGVTLTPTNAFLTNTTVYWKA